MEEDSDHFEEEEEVKPAPVIEYEEEEIRLSSHGSSPNMEDLTSNLPVANTFEMFDQLISGNQQPSPVIRSGQPSVPEPQREPNEPEPEPQQEQPAKDKEDHSIIQQIEKQWIIKQAQMQRIGGTYDFFNFHLDKYKRHLQARKIVLSNITATIDKNKISKAHPIMMLKEYFKDYSSLSSEFHERCYKFELPQREEDDNKMVNLRIELKIGFEKLFNLRRQTGNQMSRLEKFMRGTTHAKLDKALEVYWGVMASHQIKANAKREHFEQKEKKFQKRIEKISKVYGKGRVGNDIDQDVFEEMAKFVKEERELRFSVYDWGKQILNLRKNIISADYNFFIELQAILTEFKNFNNTVYQLQKKKFNFLDRLKQNIESNYLFEKLCTPLDNDYVLSVLNFKNKSSISLLKQDDYETFINEEYFGDIIGETTEFLKGTIVKSFPLKNLDEDLVKTVSGYLVQYNKKSLDVKYKLRSACTSAEFQGKGCVTLKETIKGIIFDSHHSETVYFKDDNRAEEIVMYLNGEFGKDLP